MHHSSTGLLAAIGNTSSSDLRRILEKCLPTGETKHGPYAPEILEEENGCKIWKDYLVVSAGIKLIFFTVASTGLCFGFLLDTEFIIQRCFCSC